MTERGVSIVVPVYNSAQSLDQLCSRLRDVLSRLAVAYEIILVDDASADSSWNVIERLSVDHAHVRGLSLMRNYGQHNAVLCGIRAARYDVIVTMDDDLQHPPEEIPQLLAAIADGYDVVYGIPHALPHSFWRNALSKIVKRGMGRAMGLPFVRDVSAFRAIRTPLRMAFEDYKSPNVLLDVLLSWGTTRFTTVSVRHEPRRFGRSNYTFRKLFNQAMFILTGFSTAPLRVASMVGFFFTLFGILLLIYVVTLYFTVGSVPGFPFLVSTIALFSGAQMFALGIIGEYLARIFARSLERPTYVVRSDLGDRDGAQIAAPRDGEHDPVFTGRTASGKA